MCKDLDGSLVAALMLNEVGPETAILAWDVLADAALDSQNKTPLNCRKDRRHEDNGQD